MQSEQQLVERITTAYGDIVDATPLAPEWERASGQIMPLTAERTRSVRWFSLAHLAAGFAATIIVVGLTVLAFGSWGDESPVVGIDTSKVVPRSEMPEWVQVAIADANEFQAGLVADDILTFDEYESAYEAYAECATANGAWISQDVQWNAELYDFSVLVGGGAEGGPAVEGAIRTCWDGTVGPLQDFWLWQKEGRPTAVEEAARDAATMADLIDCLERQGYEIPTDDQAAQNAALEEAYSNDRAMYHRCLDEVGH